MAEAKKSLVAAGFEELSAGTRWPSFLKGGIHGVIWVRHVTVFFSSFFGCSFGRGRDFPKKITWFGSDEMGGTNYIDISDIT